MLTYDAVVGIAHFLWSQIQVFRCLRLAFALTCGIQSLSLPFPERLYPWRLYALGGQFSKNAVCPPAASKTQMTALV